MNAFLPQTPAIVGAILLLASGLLQNLWTTRVYELRATRLSRLDLDHVPRKIGAWEGTDLKLRAADLDVAEASASLARRYINRVTGQELAVVLICGRPGPIAVHPPTACYRGAGYAALGEPVRHPVSANRASGDEEDTFLVANFRKPGPIPNGSVRIYWAWSGDGLWQVPVSPRLEFADVPLLFKLYVTHETTSERAAIADSDIDDFLRSLLPALRAELFQP